MSDQNSKDNIELAIRLMDSKLKRQSDAHGSLESKTGVVLGFMAVIAGSSIVILKDHPGVFGVNLFSVGLAALYASLIILILSSKTREYLDPPDFPAFYSSDALSKDNIDVKNQVAADMKASYEENGRNHKAKATLFNWSLYLFGLSLLLLFLGAIERTHS